MRSGIEDVAARAGVSTATVSRALRDLPNVSPATRQRVVTAARELDYVVSASASSLASGRTSTVGVITPYISRWFFGQVISGAETVLRRAGFDLLLYGIDTAHRRSQFFSELPLRRRVDAVLVLTLALDRAEVASLAGLGVPISTVGLAVPDFPSVRIDDEAGARAAVNHLLGLGHRRIAMIGTGRSTASHFTVPDHRRRGYLAALGAARIPVDDDYQVDGDYTVEGGERAMATLLTCPRLPTAVFAQSDEMAMGALRSIHKVGLRCPEDMSVVGFDDHEMAVLFDLTTVSQPVHEQGALAAGHLLAAVNGEPPPIWSQQVPTQLVVRGTTGPPPAETDGPVSGRRPPPARTAGRGRAAGRSPRRA